MAKDTTRDADALFDIRPVEIPIEVREWMARIEKQARGVLELCGLFHERFPDHGKPNPTSAVLATFNDFHKKKTGQPAAIVYARDGAIVKRLNQQYSDEYVSTVLIPEFFALATPRDGYTLPMLQAKVGAIVAKHASTDTRGLTERTQDNAHQSALAVRNIEQRYR